MRRYKHKDLKYYRYRNNPTILILSGTHGDETIITKLITKHLKRNEERLPGYLFIPAISPDAVRLNTRKNSALIDINRNYFKDSEHVEIQTSMEVIKQYKYDLCIDFHMDLFIDSYYMYDSQQMEKEMLLEFENELKKNNIQLLNGIDDETDPLLNKVFVDGYLVDTDGVPGTIWNWLLEEKHVKRIINPEIPGRASREKMDRVLDIFFNRVLVPLVAS